MTGYDYKVFYSDGNQRIFSAHKITDLLEYLTTNDKNITSITKIEKSGRVSVERPYLEHTF